MGRGNVKEQRKRYRQRYPEKIRKHKREQEGRKRRRLGIPERKVLSPEMRDGRRKERYVQNKAEWLTVIIELGMTKCWKCGYDKCFGAIDFHHINNNREGKKETMGYVFTLKPTSERIEHLKQCIPLCANCHRELHIDTNTMGKHRDNG